LTRIEPKFNQVIPWSLHTFPKISCKSVQPFSRNVAGKETKKSPENNIPLGIVFSNKQAE